MISVVPLPSRAVERILEPEVMDTEEDAREYDAMDHSEPNEAFVGRLVELGARGRMLDVGTGPGHVPLLVCERVAEATVVGIDLAETMLAIADLLNTVRWNAEKPARMLETTDGSPPNS